MTEKIIILACLFIQILTISQWGTYRPSNIFTLYNTQSHKSIQFAYVEKYQNQIYNQLKAQVYEAKNIYYNYHDGQSFFEKKIQTFNNCSITIRGFLNQSKALLKLTIDNPNNNTLFFYYNNHNADNQNVQQTIVFNIPIQCIHRKTRNLQIHSIINKIKHSQSLQQGESLLVQCNPQYQNLQLSININDFIYSQDMQSNSISKINQKIFQFMTYYNIPNENKNYQITKYGLSNTLGLLSYEQSPYSRYFALKNVQQEDKTDLRWSPFIIEILSHFDYELSSQIMNSIIQYLQDQIFYAQESLTKIIYPEHSQLFTYFKNPKNLKIVNSLVFISLFRNVNRVIGKQANYQSSKQLHPLIKIMLQINWESDYNYQKSISVYKESFFQDLYMNNEEQKQQLSVSKISWLIKTIQILKQLNSQNQINSVQLDSLDFGLKEYFKAECVQKNNKIFRSINIVGKNRYYTQYISYQTLTPFLYNAYPKYDETYQNTLKIIANLNSTVGIVSLQRSPAINFEYKFRGNISPYFNYKILKMLDRQQKIDENVLTAEFKKQNIDPQDGIQKIQRKLKSIKKKQKKISEYLNKILKEKIYSDWDIHHKLFGRWSPLGESTQAQSELILINCLLLAK